MAPPRHPRAAEVPAPGHGAPPRRANRVRLAASALVVLACALLLPRERETFQTAVAATANLFASWRFAATLPPGREPLISRYTRFDYGHLPADLGAYTRVLTALWAALLAGFAAAQGAVLAGANMSASGILAAEIAACAALFVGEHFVRNARFPHHRPITLRRTVRAVRLARRHAAARDGAPG